MHTPHYNSCHHRSCPLCAALARERWLDDWKTRLLDCPHSHSTLTTPQELVDFWVNRILGRDLPAEEVEPIVEFMAFGRSLTQPLPEADRNERLRYMIALILMAPTFMLR